MVVDDEEPLPAAASAAAASLFVLLLLSLRSDIVRGTIATACMAELRKEGRPGS